jgi:hypothetical protein
MGQFGAPGTTVVMAGAGGGVTCGFGAALAGGGVALGSATSRALSGTLRRALVVDAAPQPATKTTATAIATTRRPV